MPLARLRAWINNVRQSIHEQREAYQRRRQIGVRPNQRVRDACIGDLLRVDNISDKRAGEYRVNGESLLAFESNHEIAHPDDVVVECRYPGGDDTYAFPSSRLRQLEIRVGDIVRDRFTGDTLRVKSIRNTLAGNVALDNTPLTEYGVNQRLDCATDWVVDCTYRRSNREYAFPISRLVPERYPTRPERWKERVINTTACFSCNDGTKDRERSAACTSCQDRIKARDGYACQQKGCGATDDLQIHHLYYRPNAVGVIPDRYLITLCRQCHENRHGIE